MHGSQLGRNPFYDTNTVAPQKQSNGEKSSFSLLQRTSSLFPSFFRTKRYCEKYYEALFDVVRRNVSGAAAVFTDSPMRPDVRDANDVTAALNSSPSWAPFFVRTWRKTAHLERQHFSLCRPVDQLVSGALPLLTSLRTSFALKIVVSQNSQKYSSLPGPHDILLGLEQLLQNFFLSTCFQTTIFQTYSLEWIFPCKRSTPTQLLWKKSRWVILLPCKETETRSLGDEAAKSYLF